VQTIEPSPHRPGSAYVAVLRYLLGDFQPYVYRTTDYGKTWTRLTDGSNGIPADHPVRVVREDPDRAGLLYAGTEFGMFVSFDDGRRWQSLQLNLPATPITDLKVHRKDLVVATQGRSFWILDDLTPLHQLRGQLASSRAHLFKPRDAHRMRYRAGFGGVESSRDRPDEPEYPPAGAMIDYWLAPDVRGTVTLDVLDAAGKVVRSFSSEGEGERAQAPDEPGMRAPEMQRVGTPRLPMKPGLNRFVWDLAHAGPWSADERRSGRNGPLATPGVYTVRLSVAEGAGGKPAVSEQPLTVLVDPRVAKDGVTPADLRAQLAHNLRVRDMVSEVNAAVASIKAAKERIAAAPCPQGECAAADTLARLTALEGELVTPPVRYSRPGLQAHITYLYGLTTQADQRVGRDAVQRYAELRRSLDGRLAELRAILGAEAANVSSRAGARRGAER
jgi:hypothetical protein